MKRRAIFCTYPCVYSDLVLAELLRADDIELVGVVLSSRVLHKNYNHFYASLSQVKQSGFAYAVYLFVITGLYSLLLRVLRRPGLQQRLQKFSVPVLNTKDINDEEGVAFITGLQADVMLSAHFNQLVGDEILRINGLACLNIHPSLLPAYKGVDPAFYVLLRREVSTGVTVHFQDVEFDTGRILEQSVVSVVVDESLLGLNLRLFKQGAHAAIRQIRGMSPGVEQTRTGNYDSWPNARDVRKFRRVRKLFRWRELIRVMGGLSG